MILASFVGDFMLAIKCGSRFAFGRKILIKRSVWHLVFINLAEKNSSKKKEDERVAVGNR